MARWYWDKRDTVEDCRVLDVAEFKRGGWLRPGAAGTSRWTCGGRETASISWAFRNGALWLDYAVTREGGEPTPYSYPVGLTYTRPYFGGTRVWFVCPQCKRTVAKLYLAPGYSFFWCRRCLGLSYRSRQDRQSAYFRLWDRSRELEQQLDSLPQGRRRWWRALRELDALNHTLAAINPLPRMLARLEEREARQTGAPMRRARRPGRPSKRALRERERAARQAALPPPAPPRPRGRPTIKRAYHRREPMTLPTPPGVGLGYCVRCRDRRPLEAAQSVLLANGRPALRGTCADCGGGVVRIERKDCFVLNTGPIAPAAPTSDK